MMMPPMTAPMSDPPPPPPYARCRTAARPRTSSLASDWACAASIAAPLACAMASRRIAFALGLGRLESADCASDSRVRASGPILPRRVSMKSDTALIRD